MAETANQYIKKGDRVLVSSDRLTLSASVVKVPKTPD
jgi:hypothetical protein